MVTNCYLAVDAAESLTSVAIRPEKVSDPSDIKVREYTGVRVEDAVRQHLADETVDAAEGSAGRIFGG